MSEQPTEQPHSEGVGTTGHEWDGIQELNNPLPRWWLWVLYATIAFSVLWMILYPTWPIPGGNTKGVLGYSSRAEVESQIAAVNAERAQALQGLERIDINDLGKDPKLLQAAIEAGHSAFNVNCVQCHGSGAQGGIGYPNLNDDDWLWGGSYADIYQTIRDGIRQPGDDDTRMSQMPSFGRDGLLTPAQIDAVTEYVRQISHQEANAALAAQGAPLFAQQCAACHGADGTGNRAVGAPNLTDGIWLYGGDRAAIHQSIHSAHAGVMPAWKTRLPDQTIRALTAYVHSLGGGE